jgi:hypothetical protein
MYYVYLVREGLYEVTATKRDDEEYVSFSTDNTAHIVEIADWYITQKKTRKPRRQTIVQTMMISSTRH